MSTPIAGHGSETTVGRLAATPAKMLFASIGMGAIVGVVLAMTIRFLSSEGATTPLSELIAQQIVFFAGWGALVTPLWYIAGRAQRERSLAARLLILALAGVACWLVHATFLYYTAITAASRDSVPTSFWAYVVRTVYFELVVYVAVISTIGGMRHRQQAVALQQRAASLALQLSRSQLRTLQAQLHPHFLFNALHSVSMLARAGDNERIIAMTAKLAEMLRAMLDDDAENETTLRDELLLVDHYLSIELIRFSDRLDVSVDAESAALDGFVPRLILQPIVENAIRHGISRNPGRGRIDIRARREAANLVCTVTDDGPGIANDDREVSSNRVSGAPLGLRLTRERLASLYGSGSTLSVLHSATGTVATIVVPWHEQPVSPAVLL